MEPLICPQCGGQITDYMPGRSTTICGYCGTRFLIEPNKQAIVSPPTDPAPVYTPLDTQRISPFISVLVGVFLVFGFVIFAALVGSNKTPSRTQAVASTPYSSTPAPVKPTVSQPDPSLLNFGGNGVGEGLFDGATSIAVDRLGRVYVADGTLRVQQFDDKGTYLKTLAIPASGRNYSNAKGIEKIRVASDGKLYVAVGGVVLIYNENSSSPNRVVQVAPDYIQDFALKSDGGMLAISDDDKRETLIFVNQAGKFTRAIRAFHTNATNASISPQETAVEAIRLAVDGAGNIFSIYAFGSVSGYEISYNAEELVIVRFTPDGKYVNKFVPTMNSCGIEVDNQGRIYISENKGISIYSNTGTMLNSVPGLGTVDAFALDKDNNIYLVADDRVIKRAAVE